MKDKQNQREQMSLYMLLKVFVYCLFCYLKFLCIFCIVCPQRWVYFNGRCWIMNPTYATWADARDDCANRYFSSLAIVENSVDDHLLSQLALTGTESLFKIFDRRESTHMHCFKKYENTILLNAEYLSPANIYTLTQCLNECVNAKTRFQFDCRSILWFKESSECILNSKAKEEVDSIALNDFQTGVDLYDNECVFDTDLANTNGLAHGVLTLTHHVDPTQLSKTIPGVRSCFSKYRHGSLMGFVDRILDNVTERECLSECWNCGENTKCFSTTDDAICKSATYYKQAKQCVMTTKTKRTNPGAFDPSERLSDFFERRRDCAYENCEDQEVNFVMGSSAKENIALVFILDGSDHMDANSFNHSLFLVDKIITEIHETTEFYHLTLIQLNANEILFEIPLSSFDTLDDMRKSLYSISWKNISGVQNGDHLTELANFVDQIRTTYELDFVWMFFLTNGFNFEQIDNFVQIKNKRLFTSFAIGIGDDLNFPILEKLSTSNDHLIHMQIPEKIAKQVGAKLCVNNGVVFSIQSDNKIEMENFDSGIRRKETSDFESQPFKIFTQSPVWLGLHRNEYGKMVWDNETELFDYNRNILKHLESGVDGGDCILWVSPKKWIQTDCSLRYRYVCSLRPRQTINEKLTQLINKHNNLSEIPDLKNIGPNVEELIPFHSFSNTIR